MGGSAVATQELMLNPVVPTYYLKCKGNERIESSDGTCKPCLVIEEESSWQP